MGGAAALCLLGACSALLPYDQGSPQDAGMPRVDVGPEAGPFDAGPPDAGPPLDAGPQDDAGPPIDAGPPPPVEYQLAMGRAHSCSLIDPNGEGRLFCWGAGELYQNGSEPVVGAVDGDEGEDRGAAVELTFDGRRPAEVAASGDHTCVRADDGAVLCFGAGRFDAFGAPLSASALDPHVVLPPDGQTFAQIAVGDLHACARTEVGGVFCWGRSWEGQLGPLVTIGGRSSAPVEVTQLPHAAVDLSSGSDHTCALLEGAPEGRRVYCWGRNGRSQLARPNTEPSSSEPLLIALDGIDPVAIHASDNRTCAESDEGRLTCWGDSLSVDLGQTGRVETPLLNPHFAESASHVGVGRQHICAIDGSGALLCWGRNSAGQLGLNPSGPQTIPHRTDPPEGERFVGVSLGNAHTCAVTERAVYCFGDNSLGAVGTADPLRATAPQRVPNTEGATAVAVGEDTACAIVADGRVRCWGSGLDGRLGVDDLLQNASASARDVLLSTGPLVTGASELSVGRRTVCAHLPGASDPSVCWGTFESGRVGAGLSGRFNGLATAVPIPATFDAGRFALGEAHACWVDASGDRVGCVGAAAEDRLGRSDCPGPTCDTLPATADGVLVTGLSELALGRQHSCAASPTELVCWGSNALGQLGADTSDPIVRHPGAFAALDSGTNHGCAVLDGTTRCWGSNDRLQAGPGGPVIRTLGTPGIMIGSPTLIAAGHSHTCASNGVSVECWGANDQGQLGSGRTDAPHASSEDVVFPQAPDAILSLDAGDDFTCAVATIAGMSEVYCWGRGSSGRLGSGRQILYPTPQRLD